MVSTVDLMQARRSAKRTRAALACSRCKVSKSKCSDYRPCGRCTRAGQASLCLGANNNVSTYKPQDVSSAGTCISPRATPSLLSAINLKTSVILASNNSMIVLDTVGHENTLGPIISARFQASLSIATIQAAQMVAAEISRLSVRSLNPFMLPQPLFPSPQADSFQATTSRTPLLCAQQGQQFLQFSNPCWPAPPRWS